MNIRRRLKARLAAAQQRQVQHEITRVSGYGYGMTWLAPDGLSANFNYERWAAEIEKAKAAWIAFFDVYGRPQRLMTSEKIKLSLALLEEAKLASAKADEECLL